MIHTIDLINGDEFYLDKFFDIAIEAEEMTAQNADKLKYNYQNIWEDYIKYECFTLVLEDDEPVAFSGLQKYNDGLVRALTRTYYAQHVRKKDLGIRKLPSLASKYMLPLQFKYAQEHGHNNIFVSFQANLEREKFVHLFSNMLNESKVCGDYKWQVPSTLFNTCPSKCDKPDCWQWITATNIDKRIICESEIDLPQKSVDREIE